MKVTRKSPNGFTLIELLVVISIIGFIASFATYAFNDARREARDAKRISDITQIQKALELYYADNDNYPPVNYAYTNSAADGCGIGGRWCALENILAPYIKPLPRDPLGLQDNYRYYYDADPGNNYATYGFMIRLEDPGNYDFVVDGGYTQYNNISTGSYYEIGEQPTYCMGTAYSGGNKNWWGGQDTVCQGGN
ncbi:MAG: type II secretion system protein [Patescibacteria group bacterium]